MLTEPVLTVESLPNATPKLPLLDDALTMVEPWIFEPSAKLEVEQSS